MFIIDLLKYFELFYNVADKENLMIGGYYINTIMK